MHLFLLTLLFVFACDSTKRYRYGGRGYEREHHEYRAVIKRIRDVMVDSSFDVRATIEDRDGDILSDNIEVELELTGGDRRADLQGRTEKETRRGHVIFSNLRIDRPGRNYRVELSFDVDGEEFYSESNRFDVTDDDDDDSSNGISIGGSLLSIDMQGLPTSIVAGQALPNLTFTMKLLGNKGLGGVVSLEIKDERGSRLDDALLVWRKPTLSAIIRSGKAVFTEAFFSQALDEDADLVAKVIRFVGTKKFALPRVHAAAIEVDVNRISINAGDTEIYGILRLEAAPCSSCVVNSYLVSNDKVKDAAVTTTDNTGAFTATIADWHCASGGAYRGAVKVSRAGSNYYALLRANCG